MWASASFAPSPSCFPTTITKPAERFRYFPVPVPVSLSFSSKFKRGPPRGTDGDDRRNAAAQHVGELGRAVATALESDPQIRRSNSNKQQQKKKNSSSGKQTEGQLSGSDVLLALQSATDQKIKKKKRKPTKDSLIFSSESRRGNHTEQDDDSDSSNFRPICIKSDWSHRLDELDNQLHEFVHAAT